MAILESNIHDGPTYFNCYPNYLMDLRNLPTRRALGLNTRTPETIIDEGTTCLTAIYHVHYKVFVVGYNFKALRSSLKNETIVLETILRKSKLITRRRLKHVEDLAKMPEEWKLKEIMPPKWIENTKIEQIIQDEDGNVTLKMKRNYSMKDFSREQSRLFEQMARHSIDNRSTSIDLRRVNFEPNIPKPI